MTLQPPRWLRLFFRWYVGLCLAAVWITAGIMLITGVWNQALFDLTNQMWRQGIGLLILWALFSLGRLIIRVGWRGLRWLLWDKIE